MAATSDDEEEFWNRPQSTQRSMDMSMSSDESSDSEKEEDLSTSQRYSHRGRWSSPRKSVAHPRTISDVRQLPGASNAGKYSTGPFCGSTPKTFPVNDQPHTRAALSYRRHDPNPERVRSCACNRAKELNLNFPSCGVHGKKTTSKRSSRKMY